MQPPAAEDRARPLERLAALVLPGLLRIGSRLSPQSLPRRALIRASVPRIARAASRPIGLTMMIATLEPDCVLNAIGWSDALGIDEQYHGPEGLHTFTEEWTSQMHWPSFDLRHYVDFGERIYIEVFMTSRGLASGAETNRIMGYVAYFSPRGRVARLDTYWHVAEARAVCGL